MNCSFGFEWLAEVVRQHLRGLAGESGVATGQDLGATLFGEGAQREGCRPKPEAMVLPGARAAPLAIFSSISKSPWKAASASDQRQKLLNGRSSRRIYARRKAKSTRSVCAEGRYSNQVTCARRFFEYLQEREPGRFQERQLRRLQRRIKNWRALERPPREGFFAKEHYPGELCQSEFTHCRELGITINGQVFPHFGTYSSVPETGELPYIG